MVRMAPRPRFVAIVFAAWALSPFPPASAAVIHDYVALGDSMAFGEPNFTANPSNGDRGYVSLYATRMGQQ